MKTLKYLMLLLAVAVALPAMAQEKATKAVKALEGENLKINEIKDKGTGNKVTTGKLGKFTYEVQGGEDLLARVISPKGYVLELRKGSTGKAQRFCSGDAKYCKAMSGFTYVEDAAVENMDVYEDVAAEEEASAEEEEYAK